jgi:cytochrome c oxidase assembly protein subunit 15
MVTATQNIKSLRIWLVASAAMVFVMAIIGAVTRLSEAGLSMVDWRPILGWLPPLSQEDWKQAFAAYKQSPEFAQKHFWMGLDDFKRIYWLEWLHRLWGRLTGLVYIVPLLVFWLRGMIPKGHGRALSLLAVLIGVQGVLGWYMVKSGLVERPSVSHYRLAAHLGLACVIYALMIRALVRLSRQPALLWPRGMMAHGLAGLALLAVTIVWGAFVAGLDAGLIYNSFPDMGGALVPPELGDSGLAALHDNRAGVQFIHRWLGMLTALVLIGLWAHGAMRGIVHPLLFALALAAIVQAGLGILTLLTQVWLPLAALHQAGALIVLTVLIMLLAGVKRD